jgi:hypothetical protein
MLHSALLQHMGSFIGQFYIPVNTCQNLFYFHQKSGCKSLDWELDSAERPVSHSTSHERLSDISSGDVWPCFKVSLGMVREYKIFHKTEQWLLSSIQSFYLLTSVHICRQWLRLKCKRYVGKYPAVIAQEVHFRKNGKVRNSLYLSYFCGMKITRVVHIYVLFNYKD